MCGFHFWESWKLCRFCCRNTPLFLRLWIEHCHGIPCFNTITHTITKSYLSSYMIYWGLNGNGGWYGYWCYGLVLVGRDWHYRRDKLNARVCTSIRSAGFCIIWVYIWSSSSSKDGVVLETSGSITALSQSDPLFGWSPFTNSNSS